MSSNTPSGSWRPPPNDRRFTEAVQQVSDGRLTTESLVRALFDLGSRSRVPPPGSDVPAQPRPAGSDESAGGGSQDAEKGSGHEAGATANTEQSSNPDEPVESEGDGPGSAVQSESVAPIDEMVLQAEDATLNNATTTNKGSGYTGTGYVVYQQDSGADIQWSVDVGHPGPHDLVVRYASEDDLTMELRVNGDLVVEAFSFPATGGPTEWDTVEATVDLQAGENRVRLVSVEGGPHVDRLEVSGGD
jgi:hypothetical protein